jgi:hypothetical protein
VIAHSDDLVAALELAAAAAVTGDFAVGCDGSLSQAEVESRSGLKSVELPARLTFSAAQRLHRLGVTPAPAVEPARGGSADRGNGRPRARGARRLPTGDTPGTKAARFMAAGGAVAVLGGSAAVVGDLPVSVVLVAYWMLGARSCTTTLRMDCRLAARRHLGGSTWTCHRRGGRGTPGQSHGTSAPNAAPR